MWGGFSFNWYQVLARDRALIDAALLSVQIAACSATFATVIGTLASLSLARAKPLPGASVLAMMLSAPLVMPEVIIGLSLLLLFVALDVERGFWTVTCAHTTLASAFTTVVIRARLAHFDQRLVEAAQDLGCPPWKLFFVVTLPLIAPGLIAAWLLAFTLSLDDLVIASFTTGPGATTLPIRIYSSIRLGVSPEINAVCTIMVSLVALALFLSWRAMRGAARGERF